MEHKPSRSYDTSAFSTEAVDAAPRRVVVDPTNRFRLDPAFLAEFEGKQPAWGPIGYVVYKRTYARRVGSGDAQRSEEFWETLRRVTEGTFSLLKQQIRGAHRPWDDSEAQRKAQDFYRRMWAFKWLPPGRGLWIMGTEYLERHGGGAANNCGFVSTARVADDFAGPFCALMDWSMLGVGMGFDTRGAGKVRVVRPAIGGTYFVQDTREGWIDLIRTTLSAYVGVGALPYQVDVSGVRRAGEPINGFGGTASGPEPLLELWAGTQRILGAIEGQLLTSAAITDLMNLIGRCVVAGNVRRSSEIALGDIGDADFLALKDPTRDREIAAEQRRIELANGIDIAAAEAAQRQHSPLSPEFAAAQRLIDDVKARRYSIPEWAALDAERWSLPLNAWRWASNNTVWADNATGDDLRRVGERIAHNGEPGIGWLGRMRSHGRLSDPPTHDDSFADGMNPCGEQTLWDAELCCLVETFPTKHLDDGRFDLEDYKATLKMAYLYAKVVSGIPTHRVDTNAVMAANRRIGTSQAGIVELYETLGLSECRRIWDEGYRYVTALDAEYSRWMACPRSIKRTSVKPGGSIPLLPGVEGGMKWPSSRFYMRTVRIDRGNAMVPVLQRLGYRVEPNYTENRSVVAYFPVRSNARRFAAQVSLWEQAELAAALQAYWSDNMVSCTLTFRKEEAADVPRVIEAFSGRLKTVSFLPVEEHGYLQAPYIPCSEAEYEAAVVAITGDVSEELSAALGGVETKAEDERFCSGDLCMRPV